MTADGFYAKLTQSDRDLLDHILHFATGEADDEHVHLKLFQAKYDAEKHKPAPGP